MTASADLKRLRIERPPENATAPSRGGRRALGASIVLLILAGLGYGALRLTGVEEAPALRTDVVRTGGAAVAGDRVLTATGYVVAQRAASVASKATGRLVYLGVEEGDSVEAGQVLGRVESDDVEAALAQARAELEVARAGRDTAAARLEERRVAFERAEQLTRDRLIAQAAFEQAQAAHRVARADLSSAAAGIVAAEAEVRAAEVALESTRIRAPFDGTVLTKQADVGEMVAPLASSPSSRGAVVTMADMASLEVEADVSESNIHAITVGAPVEIVLDAYPTRRYPGRVAKIVPTADRAKATVLTKVAFEALDERVLPEMSARVRFGIEAAEEPGEAPLRVPAAAIVVRDGETMVFRVEGERVRAVVVDRDRPEEALRAGDRLVLDPPPSLADGDTPKLS